MNASSGQSAERLQPEKEMSSIAMSEPTSVPRIPAGEKVKVVLRRNMDEIAIYLKFSVTTEPLAEILSLK